ncbi:MAG: tRNA (adenosine(37)-N6)-dimethylallyltransferase MiaA [Candidatus Saganbacteria bacterium]|nr:tRNA (adenosine(37)-N6)-dimethylallyltransferase MiaA [Candidatus Saganbacteria bacterium]
MPSPVLVIFGQTAVGKSAVALELAKELHGEIISADSMQVYRGMDIGTAKPSKKEQSLIPHHLIDIRNPDESWTVVDFVKEAKELIPEIQKRKKVPIIVGGTGLYLWSLLEGFSFPSLAADPALRKELEERNAEDLHHELQTVDPDAAAKIHPNNKKRVVRALEVFKLTGTPFSRFNKKEKKETSTNSPHLNVGNHQFLLFGLTLPNEEVYARINQRVDQMIEKGLVTEVEALVKKGYSKELPAMEALGYKEIVQYLEGAIKLEDTINQIKQGTRNFAKRQRTWFRRFENVNWTENKDPENTKKEVLSLLK